ncbi:MAG: ABC transporter permease [Gemmatimonadales bacterium]|nr:MAG: ABC transporter permease [Gemmatimonadales bacterium]
MYALREAWAALRRAPLLTALSAAMVALALFVVGLFGVATWNLQQALSRIEDRVEVVAYVRDDARQDEVTLAETELLRMPEVRDVRYISKEEALISARQDLPEFEDLFMELEVNPLPASLEIELEEGFRTPDAVARVAELAAVYPFIEDVRYGQEWVDRLFLLQRIGAITTGVLGTAFAVVAALIIGTAIRIALFARREEIYVMRLVGATRGFIRRPFLLEGAFTGVVGGLLAAALTYASFLAVSRLIFPLEWIPLSWMVAGIGAGVVFGLIASALAVRRHLREI